MNYYFFHFPILTTIKHETLPENIFFYFRNFCSQHVFISSSVPLVVINKVSSDALGAKSHLAWAARKENWLHYEYIWWIQWKNNDERTVCRHPVVVVNADVWIFNKFFEETRKRPWARVVIMTVYSRPAPFMGLMFILFRSFARKKSFFHANFYGSDWVSGGKRCVSYKKKLCE